MNKMKNKKCINNEYDIFGIDNMINIILVLFVLVPCFILGAIISWPFLRLGDFVYRVFMKKEG